MPDTAAVDAPAPSASAPSDAQIQAGNYPKGHVWAHGMRISIENPAGSVRSGTGEDGEPWDSRLQHDYGYVRGTRGADGDHVDVFLGPDFKDRSLPVHVIDQHDPATGKFDEHKAMLGFKDAASAVQAYHANYPDGWAGARAVTPLHVDAFKAWATAPGARKTPMAAQTEVPKFAGGGAVGDALSAGLRNLGALATRNAIGVAGTPVDAMNWALKHAPGTDLGSAEPVGGTDWLTRKAHEYGMSTESGNPEADAWGDAAAGLLMPPQSLRAAAGLAVKGAANLAAPAALGKQAGVLKTPGGNWLSGSVEGALQGLQRKVRTEGVNGHTAAEVGQDTALNNWVDTQLTRYVKNDMATERDPIRALAEQGTLHVDPAELNFGPGMHCKYIEPGQTAVARGDAAKAWEGAADLKVYPTTARQIVGNESWMPSELDTRISANPWLNKVAPDTSVYGVADPRNLSGDLGFNHLIDELRNSTNPASGLPAHLQLDPSSLSRVSVPQAVQRVSDINAWRAAQKAEADSASAFNPATVLHKSYGEGSPYSWYELKKPEPGVVDRKEALGEDFDSPYAPSDATLGSAQVHSHLQTALSYEGNQMGHCVGGYGDDVANGSSRIFSLRDAKGQPHVTIETRPTTPGDQLNHSITTDFKGGELPPDNIVQIKGKGNTKPAAQYLPAVQDFVKSGSWGSVGDLQNSGLRKTSDAFNDNELGMIRAAGGDPQAYHTPEELKALAESTWPGKSGAGGLPDPQPYASGGGVASSNLQLAPLGGWGWGYMNGATPAAASSPPVPDFTLPEVTQGGHSSANITGTTPGGAPGAGAGAAGGLSRAAGWAGVAAQFTKDPTLGQAAGLVGTAADASAGQYGSLGAMLGRLAAGTPLGGTLGSLAGQALSDGGINGRNAANTLAAAVPGVGPVYGLANFASSGALGRALFGGDATPTESGGYTPSTPGLLGDLGRAQAGTFSGTGITDAQAAQTNPNYSNEGLHAPSDPAPSPSGTEG